MVRPSIGVGLLLVVLVSSCSEPGNVLEPDHAVLLDKAVPTPESSEAEWLKALKQVTARFNSLTLAQAEGYTPEDICVALPGVGGMGYHWPNFPLIDGVFEPLKPEVLVFAKAPNGHLRLMALEYVVLDVGQPRPAFAGHAFDDGDVPPLLQAGIPHWTLHVWLFEENPLGIHAPFNPTVSCP